MATARRPDSPLFRRHAAAMAIIADLPPEQRGLTLLTLVLCGSPDLDEAVEAAERAGRPLPAARGRRVGVPV